MNRYQSSKAAKEKKTKRFFNKLFLGKKTNRRSIQFHPQIEGLEERALMSASPAFTVASPFTEKVEAANASAANGLSVAVWAQKDNTGDTDIRAQMYNGDGTERGDVIDVASTENNESDPAVAMSGDGQFVVVWTRTGNSDGDQDVLGHLFTSDGEKNGNEIYVADTDQRHEFDADVAMDSDGDFVVSYTRQYYNDTDVMAHRYSGAPLSFQGTVEVSASNQNNAFHSSVAVAADGRFVVAYQEDMNVLLNRYSAAGAQSGGVVTISDSGTATNPDVASDAGGNSVVVWEEGIGGSNRDIQARRILSNGIVANALTINAESEKSDEFDPTIAMSSAGNRYAVAYAKDQPWTGATQPEEIEVTWVSIPEAGSDSVEDREIIGSHMYLPDVSIDGNHALFLTNIDYANASAHQAQGRWDVMGNAAPAGKLAHDFNIELKFNGGMTPSQRNIVRLAADRWERVIIGDLPDMQYQGYNVDDVLIDVSTLAIDGPSDSDGDGVFDTPGTMPVTHADADMK